MSKKFSLLLVLVLVLGTLLAACSSQPTSDEKQPETSDGEKKVEGGASGGDLVIALQSDAVNLDPHLSTDSSSSNITHSILETLVYLDENLEIKTLLATEYERIDELTWVFKLREGIKFHDGTDFTAEAVKATYERVLDPSLGSPRASLFNMIEEISVLGDYEIQFTTKFPFTPLPNHLAHTAAGIISPKAIEADKAGTTKLGTHPVGTGPFVFDNWISGQEITLKKNEAYWGEVAKVDSVTFKVIPEVSTRMAMLETGEAHIADYVGSTNVPRIENSSEMELVRVPSLALNYVSFNVNKEPFDDIRVRQAISMAINKEEIIAGVLDGIGTKANGPIGSNVFGYHENIQPLEHDLEKAKELLTEAGYPDGFKTTIWTNDRKERVDIAELIQAQLKPIGVDVEIEILEWGAYLEKTSQGEHDMFILGWVTVTADADYGMHFLFHTDNHGSAGNRSFYSNPQVDKLLDEARQVNDQVKRAEMYQEIQDYLVDEAPMLYLYFEDYLHGIRSNVKGYWLRADNMMRLSGVSIE